MATRNSSKQPTKPLHMVRKTISQGIAYLREMLQQPKQKTRTLSPAQREIMEWKIREQERRIKLLKEHNADPKDIEREEKKLKEIRGDERMTNAFFTARPWVCRECIERYAKQEDAERCCSK